MSKLRLRHERVHASASRQLVTFPRISNNVISSCEQHLNLEILSPYGLTTMSLTQDVHALLRFLSQDAKIPLVQAMSKIKDLQAAKLNT